MKHLILRTYIALVRDEHFTLSETGETLDFVDVYSKEDVAKYPLIQRNWVENEQFREEVCQALNITDQQFFNKGIIPKPSMVQNLVYSAELRRIFGVEKLRFMAEFDRNGNFILPSQRGFLIPKREKGLIVSINLQPFSVIKKKGKEFNTSIKAA